MTCVRSSKPIPTASSIWWRSADAAALRYAALMVASTPDEYARLIGGGIDA